jgi:hypothetical protein
MELRISIVHIDRSLVRPSTADDPLAAIEMGACHVKCCQVTCAYASSNGLSRAQMQVSFPASILTCNTGVACRWTDIGRDCLGHLSSPPTLHGLRAYSVLIGLMGWIPWAVSASSHHRYIHDRLWSRLGTVRTCIAVQVLPVYHQSAACACRRRESIH